MAKKQSDPAEEVEETDEATETETESEEEETEEGKAETEEGEQEEVTLKKYAGTFGSVEDLEDAYSKSSSEGARLGQVVKTLRGIVQKDPLLKERLQQHLGLDEEKAPEQNTGIPNEDRVVLDQIKAEQERKNKESWFKFVEQNPTFENPEMVSKLEEVIPAVVEGGRRVGKVYTFDEILKISSNIINPNEDNTRGYMSKDGITTGSSSGKTFKPRGDSPLSDEEKEMASSLGLTEKEYAEGKKLRK